MPSGLDIPTLPKDPVHLCRIIDQHVRREERKLLVRRTRWDLARAYADGARMFKFTTGGAFPKGLGAFHFTDEGKMPLQISDLLTQANKIHGALHGIDMRPVATRQTVSLAGIRERAIAQVIANSTMSTEQVKDAMSRFIWTFIWLGSCGLQGHTGDFPNIGLKSEVEVVDPTEIFPFPSLERDMSKQRGIIRQRLFPLEAIGETLGPRIMRNIEKMKGHIFERRIGDPTEVDVASGLSGTDGQRIVGTRGPGIPAGKAKTDSYRMALVRELYMEGPDNTCSRFFSCIGNYPLQDETYDFVQTYCPLAYDRFYETGDFRGAGLFDILFSTVRQFEQLVEDLINNVKDVDAFPLLILPSGVVNERVAFKNDGKKMRYMSVDMEPSFGTNSSFRPITIAPHNAGDTPGKVATFLRDVIRENSPVRDILREKGRVDSLSGLQFLQEQEQRATNTPVANLARVLGRVYKYCVSATTVHLATVPRSLPISELTLDLVGVSIDFEDGTVSFKNNPLPDLSRVQFVPRERTLRSDAIRKKEAVEMARMKMDMGQPDWDGFLLHMFREGLDFAVEAETEKNAFESVQFKLLRIYNDGQTPGQIILTPHTERPDFQIRIVEGFLVSLAVEFASPAVQDALIDYHTALQFMLQNVLPESVPDPFDAALLDQVRQAQLAEETRPALPAAAGSLQL